LQRIPGTFPSLLSVVSKLIPKTSASATYAAS
jgi:hypothetical protein